MHTADLWHMFRVLRRPLTALFFLLVCRQALGQDGIGLGRYENRPYYFGITLAYNQAFYKLEHADKFLADDSALLVEPLHSNGFSLGLLGNLQVWEHLDLRFNPTLIFAEKNLHYVFGLDSSVQDKVVESILLSLPLQVKFKSDRIGNFRFYVMGGGKLDYDLASNARARKESDLVKLDRYDLGYEAGVGFEFYMPYFIFSPEIKISNGFRDIHLREPGNIHSNVIGRLLSRMVVISIHLEG